MIMYHTFLQNKYQTLFTLQKVCKGRIISEETCSLRERRKLKEFYRTVLDFIQAQFSQFRYVLVKVARRCIRHRCKLLS